MRTFCSSSFGPRPASFGRRPASFGRLAALALALPAVALALVVAAGCQHKRDDGSHGGGDEPADPTGAGAGDPVLDAPLATVDGVVITVREFQDQINRQTPYVRARYTSKEKKREFLDNLIRFEVMAKEAARRGLDKDPEVVRVMKQVMIQKLVKEEFDGKLSPSDISEAELKAYYDAHTDDYNRPAQVRAAAIILTSAADAKKVAELAKGEAGSTHAGFRELVMAHSTDETTKRRGGDLAYFTRDDTEVPKPVVEAAFGLDNGAVAGPIDAGNGSFYVIKVTGQRKPLAKTFEQVKRQIQSRLFRDKRTQVQKDFVEALRAKATVEIVEDNLDKVKIDTSAGGGGLGAGHGHDNDPSEGEVR
ncbi:peptidylprolyl isomerase [Haliangium sp.]|uniref:peptidylprolyl isomerase n=1 Tax=Haliangium sp. TaxID=2663208 RepID=UPI003D0F7391